MDCGECLRVSHADQNRMFSWLYSFCRNFSNSWRPVASDSSSLRLIAHRRTLLSVGVSTLWMNIKSRMIRVHLTVPSHLKPLTYCWYFAQLNSGIDRQPRAFYSTQWGTNIGPQKVLEINMIITNMYSWQDLSAVCGRRSSFKINFKMLQ